MTEITSPAGARPPVLRQDMLERFWQRAPGYDAQNSFFAEDFGELKEVGYLRLAVPQELGGLGLSLAETCREQRRLAYFAAPTALAVNMHIYWTGVAADPHSKLDTVRAGIIAPVGRATDMLLMLGGHRRLSAAPQTVESALRKRVR